MQFPPPPNVSTAPYTETLRLMASRLLTSDCSRQEGRQSLRVGGKHAGAGVQKRLGHAGVAPASCQHERRLVQHVGAVHVGRNRRVRVTRGQDLAK